MRLNLLRFLLSAVCLVLFLPSVCVGACQPGEYNDCAWDDQYGTSCVCTCTECPNGQTSDGTGQINSCGPTQINESGCHYTTPNVPTYCQGFGECDIQDWQDNGYKCKKFTCEDDGIVGYEVCVPTTGHTTPKFVLNANNESGVGHFEGNKCYSNERACSKFNVSVTGGSGDWTCKPEYQTGNAQWIDDGNNSPYWKVDTCKCKRDNLNISSSGCAVGHIDHELTASSIPNATTQIPYKQTLRYCGQCAPGKIPQKASSLSLGNVTFAPTNNSGWGSYSCTNVSAPYYATGCTIDFTQSNFNNVVTDCREQCSQYLTITASGATGPDACRPDDNTYTDSIGEFTLGPDKCP